MVSIRRVSKFNADYKRCLKRGYNIDLLHAIIESLANGKSSIPTSKTILYKVNLRIAENVIYNRTGS